MAEGTADEIFWIQIKRFTTMVTVAQAPDRP